jgi:putative acetyltransferase
MDTVLFRHRGFSVRPWRTSDREAAVDVIKQCLEAYGLKFEPEGGDLDVVEVESHYWGSRVGEFWVVFEESTDGVVGTAAYYEIQEGENGWKNVKGKCVELRKMYLLPNARGKHLGRTILQASGERERGGIGQV